jgi:YihY family inner membrane protein
VRRLRDARAVRLALAVHRRFSAGEGSYLAANVTYYGFLSLFPLLLLALSVTGFVLAGDLAAQQRWAARLAATIPGIGPLIGRNLQAVVRHRAGSGVIGLAGLLWTGTGAAEASGFALSKIFGVPEYKGFVRKKAWSIGSTLGLGLLAMAAAGAAGAAGGHSLVLRAAGVAVAFALDFVLFLAAYRVLVQRRGPPFAKLWKGALFAALGWTTLKAVGAWYAARTVTHGTAVYGTFGSVVGVLALLSLSARLFLYGAALNAELIDEGRPVDEPRSGDPANAAQRAVDDAVDAVHRR